MLGNGSGKAAERGGGFGGCAVQKEAAWRGEKVAVGEGGNSVSL